MYQINGGNIEDLKKDIFSKIYFSNTNYEGVDKIL